MKMPNIKQLTTDIIDFQNLVLRISEYMEQTPEEVIRELINSRWDIRECLDYKDIVVIIENNKISNKKYNGGYKDKGIPAEL